MEIDLVPGVLARAPISLIKKTDVRQICDFFEQCKFADFWNDVSWPEIARPIYCKKAELLRILNTAAGLLDFGTLIGILNHVRGVFLQLLGLFSFLAKRLFWRTHTKKY